MAGIDKTYCTWKQYLELKEWCKNTTFTYDNGVKGSPLDFLYSYNEPYEGEAPVWNTPEGFDRWLYHNCPLSFIQERLKEQYPDNYLDKPVKQYPRGTRYIILTKPKYKFRYKHWYVDIYGYAPDGYYWYYGWDSKQWYNSSSLMPSETRSSCAHPKNITARKLNRLIKKWNLPIGTVITLSSRYIGSEYKIKIVK